MVISPEKKAIKLPIARNRRTPNDKSFLTMTWLRDGAWKLVCGEGG